MLSLIVWETLSQKKGISSVPGSLRPLRENSALSFSRLLVLPLLFGIPWLAAI